MADTELLPPVPLGSETEEERRRRLNPAPTGATMPPVPVPASERTRANNTPLTGRAADLAIGATVQPTLPPVRTTATPAPEIAAPAPVMPPVKVNAGQPAKPAPNPFESETPAVQPSAMPPIKIGPQQKAYEDLSAEGTPKLSGWRKALDAIGSIFPIGRAIETAIPGSPQNYNAKLNNAALAAAKEQTIGAGQREAESATAKAQFETPEKRRAYIAAHPDEFEGVDDFQKNDFILAGKFPQREPAQPKAEKPENLQQDYADAVVAAQKAGKDPAQDPKVQQLADAITSLQKQPAPPKENKAVAGTVAGRPAWGVQTDKGWIDPQTQKAIPNFQPAPNYAQVAPTMRSTNVIRNGQLMAIHPDELQPGDVLAGASAGTQTMSKEAQFQEIHSGIDSLRSAIKNLDKPFTPVQIGKLTLAMKHTSDPTVFQNEIATLLGTQELTPAQEDLVIWMGHLNERALSLRNIAGMGQGSDSMRSALQAILPSVRSGSVEMMNKQLAAFENQVQKLEKGVPKMPGSEKKDNPLGLTPPGQTK